MSDWPAIEIDDDGYPTDECMTAWRALDYLNALDHDSAGRFLLTDFLALDGMGSCSVTVEDGVDDRFRKPEPIKIVRFHTGGWSGAEDAIEAITRLFWIQHFHTKWERGGHFTFEVPACLAPVSSPAT